MAEKLIEDTVDKDEYKEDIKKISDEFKTDMTGMEIFTLVSKFINDVTTYIDIISASKCYLVSTDLHINAIKEKYMKIITNTYEKNIVEHMNTCPCKEQAITLKTMAMESFVKFHVDTEIDKCIKEYKEELKVTEITNFEHKLFQIEAKILTRDTLDEIMKQMSTIKTSEFESCSELYTDQEHTDKFTRSMSFNMRRVTSPIKVNSGTDKQILYGRINQIIAKIMRLIRCIVCCTAVLHLNKLCMKLAVKYLSMYNLLSQHITEFNKSLYELAGHEASKDYEMYSSYNKIKFNTSHLKNHYTANIETINNFKIYLNMLLNDLFHTAMMIKSE